MNNAEAQIANKKPACLCKGDAGLEAEKLYLIINIMPKILKKAENNFNKNQADSFIKKAGL